jgi:hypothetical protein
VTGIRSRQAKESFTAYLEAHPEQRFWQAVRNWSGEAFIFAIGHDSEGRDTFYWEGRVENRD